MYRKGKTLLGIEKVRVTLLLLLLLLTSCAKKKEVMPDDPGFKFLIAQEEAIKKIEERGFKINKRDKDVIDFSGTMVSFPESKSARSLSTVLNFQEDKLSDILIIYKTPSLVHGDIVFNKLEKLLKDQYGEPKSEKILIRKWDTEKNLVTLRRVSSTIILVSYTIPSS